MQLFMEKSGIVVFILLYMFYLEILKKLLLYVANHSADVLFCVRHLKRLALFKMTLRGMSAEKGEYIYLLELQKHCLVNLRDLVQF